MSDRANQDDGGPAFPGIEGQDGYGNYTMSAQPSGDMACVAHNQGMSLRDWFAGMAMTADETLSINAPFASLQLAAEHYYRIADAMLAERSKSQ